MIVTLHHLVFDTSIIIILSQCKDCHLQTGTDAMQRHTKSVCLRLFVEQAKESVLLVWCWHPMIPRLPNLFNVNEEKWGVWYMYIGPCIDKGSMWASVIFCLVSVEKKIGYQALSFFCK